VCRSSAAFADDIHRRTRITRSLAMYVTTKRSAVMHHGSNRWTIENRYALALTAPDSRSAHLRGAASSPGPL
jgi:hypothetical protein